MLGTEKQTGYLSKKNFYPLRDAVGKAQMITMLIYQLE